MNIGWVQICSNRGPLNEFLAKRMNWLVAGALEGGPLGGGGGGGAFGALRPAGSPPAPSLGASRHSLIGFQVVCPEQIDELCSAERGDGCRGYS
ncbi:unnamed protein product [Euphydryas editha]|uniref:Uncharacterized protein n=1 Tax=Euphydryas editha TaxID=104508 RepID=A0AAU9UKW4_EUPED|nr:unnamed protein product [Euphydryas editha]